MDGAEGGWTCCTPGGSVKLLYWSEEGERGVCIKHWKGGDGGMKKVWRITKQSWEDVKEGREEVIKQIEKLKDDGKDSQDNLIEPELLEKSLQIIDDNFDKLNEYLENEELCKFSESNNGCKGKLSSDQVSNDGKLPAHQGYMPYLDPGTLFELVSISIERIEDGFGLQYPALKEDNQTISDENIQSFISEVNNKIKEILNKEVLLYPKDWKLFSNFFNKLENKGVIKLAKNFNSRSLSKTLIFEMTSNAFNEYKKQKDRGILMGIKDTKPLYNFMLVISFRRVARLQNLRKFLTTDSKFFFRRIFEFREKEEKIQKSIHDKTLHKDNDDKHPCEHDDGEFPSFYCLPEYEIKLCFLHRFHIDYKDLSEGICDRPHNLFETFNITKKPIPRDVRKSLLIDENLMIGEDIVLENINYFKEFIQNELILHGFENEKKYRKNKQSQGSPYFEDDQISTLWDIYDQNKESYL